MNPRTKQIPNERAPELAILLILKGTSANVLISPSGKRSNSTSHLAVDDLHKSYELTESGKVKHNIMHLFS